MKPWTGGRGARTPVTAGPVLHHCLPLLLPLVLGPAWPYRRVGLFLFVNKSTYLVWPLANGGGVVHRGAASDSAAGNEKARTGEVKAEGPTSGF